MTKSKKSFGGKKAAPFAKTSEGSKTSVRRKPDSSKTAKGTKKK